MNPFLPNLLIGHDVCAGIEALTRTLAITWASQTCLSVLVVDPEEWQQSSSETAALQDRELLRYKGGLSRLSSGAKVCKCGSSPAVALYIVFPGNL